MKNFCIIANPCKDRDFQLSRQMKDYIEAKGGRCHLSGERREAPEDAECIFVLGGDGTLIRTAGALAEKNIPLIGVNLGHMGYLCELEGEGVFAAIDEIMRGNYATEERMMLQGRLSAAEEVQAKLQGRLSAAEEVQAKLQGPLPAAGEGQTMLQGRSLATTEGEMKPHGHFLAAEREFRPALNDIVISRKGPLQLVELIVYVDGEYLNTFRADGIIVATPTGSTGYSMSAGGPIVDPKASLMLITPINSHDLNAKSIVMSGEEEIVIELGSRQGSKEERAEVHFDGERAAELSPGDSVAICASRQKTKILKLSRASFLELLRRKMQNCG